ncbi:hypothetical protein DESC_370063 [Desulfosarcina cetonica]|uniref:hypothetical protein n=1 Tax=Desulfosarcina cetonica TaxID=90730 RepID=UPI0006CFB81F|nr:hypothetical protein [Desulfosarcina cetonica]VTR65694.1 hypothetical protein DESC_370063 [Desulfosarcina cetonica]
MKADPLAIVDNLARYARHEPLPRVDVTGRVIPRLRQPSGPSLPLMAVVAATTLTAAAGTTLAILPLVDFFTNPLNVYFASAVGWFL